MRLFSLSDRAAAYVHSVQHVLTYLDKLTAALANVAMFQQLRLKVHNFQLQTDCFVTRSLRQSTRTEYQQLAF